jgi:hypothetical protein
VVRTAISWQPQLQILIPHFIDFKNSGKIAGKFAESGQSSAGRARAQRVFPRFSASPDFDNRVALLAAQRKTLRFMDGASLYLRK